MSSSLLFSIQSIITAVLSVILGVFTLANNYKKRLNRLWFLVSLTIGVWSLGLGLEVVAPNSFYALAYNRMLYCGATLVPIFFYHFVVTLLNIEKKRKISLIFGYVFFPIFFLANFTPYFVTGVPPAAGFDYWVSTGPLYLPYFAGFVSYFLYSMATLIYYLPKVRGTVKNQAKFMLFTGIFGFFGGVTNFLPQLISVYPFGNYFVWIYLVFVTYAIVKHRLMDIRLVVARSVAYLVLLATLAGFYAGSVLGLERLLFPQSASEFNLAEGAMRTVIAVIMVFLFQPLKKWITKATDSVFFKNRYEPQQLLDELSHTIGSTIVLIEMLYRVNDLLIKNMKLSRSAFVLFKNDDEEYTSQAIGYKGWPPIDVPEFVKMVKRGPLIYDELEENSTYKRLLRKHDAAIIFPIVAEDELIGVYLAGEKSSGDMFSQQDIKIYEILTPEIAVAIENAKSYEEISKFNVTLRQEVKRATKHLKEKNEQLRELDNAKDEFISMASHQLRTPLTAIKGYLSMLLEGDAGEIKVSQYDFINEAYSAAGRMVGLINDLLNVSRMETGRFFLEPKEVDLERVIDEEVKQLQNHAREKGLSLKVDIKGKIPHIYADETKIRQVVMNFIDNAVYYTQNGGVTVKLHKDSDDVIFEVVDTGIGVPKEQQQHLFEKFFRADNARQNRPDGTGLGIYLAKRVTEDHGGKVIFHSEEGKGSTFGFKFPIKAKIPAKATLPPKGMGMHPAAPALSSASTMLSANPDKNHETVTPAPVATHPE